MRPVERLTIPAAGVVRLAPGGYHLMFVGLRRSLKSGDALPAVLVFAGGARVTASLSVGLQPPAGAGPHH